MKKTVQAVKKRALVYKRDLANIVAYGFGAPRHMETIWVNPRDVKLLITREEIKRVTGLSRNEASGVVIDWDDIRETLPVAEEYRIKYCLRHWVDGVSWEELGVYDFMSETKKYGRDPMSKIKARFDMLDKAYEETRATGRLKTRKEVNPGNFREEEGILIHIGRDGVPFFGGNGFHRFAIALALELQTMPAYIGVVDREAVGLLHTFRKPSAGVTGKE